MTVGKSANVVVVLSNGQAPTGLITGTTPTTVITIETPCLVTAELFGTDFSISPSGPRQEGFADGPAISWNWSVTPIKSGSHLVLGLSIDPVLVDHGVTLTGNARTFQQQIDVSAVSATTGHRIVSFFSNVIFLTVLGAIITALLGTAATIWWTRRHDDVASPPAPKEQTERDGADL